MTIVRIHKYQMLRSIIITRNKFYIKLLKLLSISF